MKKVILGIMTLTAAASVFAQGTVVFNNRVTGTLVTQVFAPVGDGSTQVVGNSATNTPAGTQVYNSLALTGSGWTAQLWAVAGNSIPAGQVFAWGVGSPSLVGSPTTTTFRTGAASGANAVPLTAAVLTGVPLDAPSAVLQLRVFPTSFGTWAAAVAAFDLGNPLAAIGASPMFLLANIGGVVNTPPNLIGLQSFSLVTPVPEPGTLALAGLGAASLLLFRRKK